MSAFTYPGVYIEELSSGVHTITGVATSIGAFIGWAPQGPVTEAALVQSWSDYAAQFGGLDSRSKLGYTVNQFFGNGGQQAYIVRLVLNATTALATGVGYAAAQITASLGTVSGAISLGVGTPVLQSIAITPAVMPPMPIGATVALVASPTYSDGGQSPAPAGVNWTTSDATVLSVGDGGWRRHGDTDRDLGLDLGGHRDHGDGRQFLDVDRDPLDPLGRCRPDIATLGQCQLHRRNHPGCYRQCRMVLQYPRRCHGRQRRQRLDPTRPRVRISHRGAANHRNHPLGACRDKPDR